MPFPQAERTEVYAGEQRLLPRPELHPNPETVRADMLEASLVTAIPVVEIMQGYEPVPEGEKLPSQIKEDRIAELDNAAGNHLGEFVGGLGYRVDSVGCEGLKDIHKLNRDIVLVLGEYGTGDKVITLVSDPVEGTTAATHRRPGALSIVAASTFNGLMPTPNDIKYLDKLMGPHELAGKISILNDPEVNIDIARNVFRVPAKEINIVAMNRKTNEGIIEAARRTGASLQLIEAGDLMPGLMAVSSPSEKARNGRGIHLLMGRGGFEEGTITAAAARALGGHAEARIWEPSAEDKDMPKPGGKLLGLNELVPGRQEHTLVAFTLLTDDTWFGYKGMQMDRGMATGFSVLIDNQAGFQLIPFERQAKAA